MFRRFLTLLMIAGYLTGQLAAVPHAHPSAHSGHAKAHAHSDWFTRLFKAHGHPANHHSPANHHATNHHSHDEHQQPALPEPSDSDHEGSCVYLPDLNVVSASGLSVDLSLNAYGFAIVAEIPARLLGSALLSAIQSQAPLDGKFLGCPRFLKLRTLRI